MIQDQCSKQIQNHICIPLIPLIIFNAQTYFITSYLYYTFEIVFFYLIVFVFLVCAALFNLLYTSTKRCKTKL